MAQQQRNSWQEFVHLLDEFRQNLEKLETGLGLVTIGPEESNGKSLACQTISTVFLNILDIWIDVIGTIKTHSPGEQFCYSETICF